MKIFLTACCLSVLSFYNIIAQNQAPQILNDNTTALPVVVNSSYYDRYNDGTKILTFSSAAYQPFTIKAANAGGVLNFRALLPPGYDQTAAKTYPLVINLHGLGESGDSNGNCGSSPCLANNEKQLYWWGNQDIQANNGSFPAFYIFPQNITTYWNNGQQENGYMQFRNPATGQPYAPSDPIRQVIQLVDFIVNQGITTNGVKFNIDPNRIYVMGYSLGANGAFDLLLRRPDLFAAGIPISVNGDRYEGKTLAEIPVWYWQGTQDGLFPAAKSRVVRDSMFKYAGFRRDRQFTDYQWNANDTNLYTGNKRYTEVSSSGHNTWTFAIQHPDLYRWLFSQNKLKINAFGDTVISVGSRVKIGVALGFAEYQWKRDTKLLTAVTNEILADTAGKYTVRIRRSQAGWSDWSQPLEIRNPVLDSTSPTPPANLSASALTNTTFRLSWSASTDNVGVTGYDVYKDGIKFNSSPVAVAYLDITGLTANTAYSITVKARDAAGNTSTASQPLVVTTLNTTLPILESTLLLNFGWQYSTPVAGYNNLFPASFPVAAGTTFSNLVKNDGTASALNFVLVSPLSGGGSVAGCGTGVYPAGAANSWWRVEGNEVLSAKITGLSPSKTYTLTFYHNSGSDDATAVYTLNGTAKTLNGKSNCSNTAIFAGLLPNAAGEVAFTLGRNTGYYQAGLNVLKIEQFSSGATDTQAPTVPSGLTASNITTNSLTLAWAAATDNVGVSGYNVFVNNTKVSASDITGTSFQVTGLAPATAYAVTVTAKDAAGNASPASTSLTVTTLPDTQAPAAPVALSASGITQTGFTLNWTAATDNVGVTGYDVFQNGVKLNTTPIVTTAFAISGLTANTTYSMTVTARDAAGNVSATSAGLAVTTLATATTPVLESTWLLNFGNQYSTPVAGYNNLFPTGFPVAAGTAFTNLKKNDGTASGVGLGITQTIPGGGGISGCTSGTYGAGGSSWWRVQTGQTMAFKFTGLASNKFYTILLFQSSGSNTVADFTIQGVTKTSNGSSNCTGTATFENLQPSAAGEIEVVIARNSGYYEAGVNVAVLRQFSAASTPARLVEAVALKNPEPTLTSPQVLTFYPNPATDWVRAAWYAETEQEIIIPVTDALGREVQQFRQYLKAGDNELNLNLTPLAAGTYFIRLGKQQVRVVLTK